MIEIKTFVFNDFSMNTFVLYDETKDCIIIDCGCNSEKEEKILSDFISDNSLNPVKLVNTHGHIDHILGNKFAKEKFNLPLYIHAEDEFFIKEAVEHGQFFGLNIQTPPNADKYLEVDKELEFGNSKLNLLHIPGHSPGSIGFYNSSQKFIIVGDVLFHSSIGRTDLPGGNHQQLLDTIKNKLFTLDEKTIVYPGHGEQTTIGFEKNNNPFF